jgi:fibronectin-binding autotransporter adhesin
VERLMKRVLRWSVVALVLLGTLAPARAQFTKASMLTQLANCLPTQTVGAVTPAILEACLASMVASYQQYPSVNPQIGTTYTYATTDYGVMVTFTNASPVAVSLPAATTTGFTPWNAYAVNLGAGAVTITPVSGTINGASSYTVSSNNGVFIVSDGSNYQVFAGSAASAAATITVGTSVISGGTSNGVFYNNGGVFGNLATANSGVLITSSGGVPSISTTLPSAITIPNAVLTGSPTGVGSVITINSQNCALAGSCTISTPLTVGTTVIASGTTNGLLYDNGGVLGNLATGASGVLVTSSGSVPSISSTLPTAVQGNITSTGTLTGGATGSGFTLALASSTVTGTVALANGGTAAALTASNGGIVYSTGSALAILSGTVTASQCLLSGASAAPTWGSCSGAAAVSSVSNGDGTLTITPTTGAVVAVLALGHANTWTAAQTFTNNDLLLLGSSSGVTTLASANSGASNFTLTFPAVTSTVAVLGVANQTFTATETFSGTLNVSGTFQLGGNAFSTTAALAVTAGTTGQLAYWSSGTAIAGENIVSALTAGQGIAITGTTNATIAVSFSKITNTLASNVTIPTAGTYVDGPSVAQGVTGTWYASGTVTLADTGTASAIFRCILWDGTNIIGSSSTLASSAGNTFPASISLSGYNTITLAGNLRISCTDTSSNDGVIEANITGKAADSKISAFRIN